VILLFNRELVSRGNLCLVSVVKDCAKMRNLPKIVLRSFENVGPVVLKCKQFLYRVDCIEVVCCSWCLCILVTYFWCCIN